MRVTSRLIRCGSAAICAAAATWALAPAASACQASADVSAVGVDQTITTPNLPDAACPIGSAASVNLPPPLPSLNFIGSIVVKVNVGGAQWL